MKNIFNGKTILVTGGVGSIGSVIVEKLLKECKPKQVRVFDHNEEGLFNAAIKLAQYHQARFFMGDVRDKNRVVWASREVDYIFHTAALKHVALNEYNPFEAIKTNVLGTENLVMTALSQKVKKFINISSDKASLPHSTMGASKLLAERITAAANYYKGESKTICASVRFGNVLNSSGSVLPLFCQQIKDGGPVTITDKRMVRYFMTIPQAVDLIFKATALATGGEVFILKMPAIKILDLAEVLIKFLSPRYGYKSTQIKIKEIGMRPGEKINERLITPLESESTLETKDMFIIPPVTENPSLTITSIKRQINRHLKLGAKLIKKVKISKEKLLSKRQIRNLLKEIKII